MKLIIKHPHSHEVFVGQLKILTTATTISSDRNSCGLNSVVLCEDLEYIDVYREFERCGRLHGKGVYVDQTARVLHKLSGNGYAYIKFYSFERPRLGEFLSRLHQMNHPAIVCFPRHMACFRNGVLYDSCGEVYKRPTTRVIRTLIGRVEDIEPFTHSFGYSEYGIFEN